LGQVGRTTRIDCLTSPNKNWELTKAGIKFPQFVVFRTHKILFVLEWSGDYFVFGEICEFFLQ
jgi:hypothetical protein